MRTCLSLAIVGLLTLSACAPKTAVVPVVSSPRFPGFVRPALSSDLAHSPMAEGHERAWLFLQAGDLGNAEREVTAALRASPGFYPSETMAGYLGLARNDARGALAMFNRALSRRADYAPALVGKGEALIALGGDADAMEALSAALAADASLVDVQRRLEVLRFRSVERSVETARRAVRAGQVDEARQAYRTAIDGSPESAFLHRELAVLERDHGSGEAALEHYRRATSLDPGDAVSLAELAEVLAARDEFDAAIKAYTDALAIGPDPVVAARRAALIVRAEVARLPQEYRAIESASQVSRGDLAALVGLRLGSLLETARRDVGVITDGRTHWAEPWILAVAQAGVMDPYDNHAFQPQSLVRRADFAQVVTRLLVRVASLAPDEARRWQNARGRFPDVPTTHLAYADASVAVAAGVMTTGADGAFQPTRLVTGAEATASLERLRALAGAPAAAVRP